MFFNNSAVICALWAHHTEFRKSKTQEVAGRDHHSLSLRLSGEVLFEAGGKATVSRKNSITFMPAGLSYRTQVTQDGTMMLIHFRTAKAHSGLQPAFFEVDNPEITSLFSELCKHYTADGANHYQCMAMLYTLLDRLEQPHRLAPKRIRNAKKFIDRNFAQVIAISALAKEAEMSEVHFRNEFKRSYGEAPLAYLKKVRIENAKHLLRSGYHSVTEVAMDCGFESTSYFSYEFKRMTGKTPSEYMKNPLA